MSVGTLSRRPLPGAQFASARELLRSPTTFAVVALTLLAAALRFARIGHQGFWFDEANTALLVHLSPGKMLGLIPQTESTPPLYYCIAWIWARIFGYGEGGLRSLSALAGVLTVPVAYGAAARLISRRAGLIAAALTACNPLLIWYSQEARSYSLLVLFTSVSLLGFAYLRENPTRGAAALWVIACALSMATHYYAVLALVPQAAWLLVSQRRARTAQVAVGAVALCGLALIPLAISQNLTGNASWIAAIPIGPRLDQLIPQFMLGFQAPAQQTLLHIVDVAVVLALLMVLLVSDPVERRGAMVAGALAFGGLALNLLLVVVGVDDLITRNVLALWLPAALLGAGGLAARRALPAGILATLAICVCGIVAVAGVADNRTFQRPDWRGVARALAQRPGEAGPRAILIQHYPYLLPLSLYMPRLKNLRRGAVAVRELDVVAISAPRVHLCWWGAACNLSATKLQSVYRIAGFHEVSRRRVHQFSIVRLLAERPVLLTRTLVARGLTTTSLRHDVLMFQR